MNPLKPRARWLLYVILAASPACGTEDGRRSGGLPGSTTPEGPASGGSSNPDEEACSPGEERTCKNVIKDGDVVIACVEGIQTCGSDGVWSACEASLSNPADDPGADGAFGSDGAQGAGFQLTATGSQSCPNNMCDQSCQVFPEESGLACPQSQTIGGGQLSNLPSGFQNHGLKDALHPPSYQGCSASADCQFDHYCDATACSGGQCGICKPWPVGGYDASKNEPDYTLRVPCGSGLVQVCNRGGATAASGAKVTVVSGNSAQLQHDLGLCENLSSVAAGSCSVPSSIPPGHCVELGSCSQHLVGTRALVVNSPEFAPPLKAEADCANNWSAYHASVGACTAAYEPVDHLIGYDASCADGQAPRWTLLAYEATLPTNASGRAGLHVHVQAAASQAALDPTCDDCTLLASAPHADPAVCTMGGPAPSCPKNLGGALGAMDGAPHLQVLFRLFPTPDGVLPATLDRWEVSYTCVDAK